MNSLINTAAFVAAIATVAFDRLILPTLDITYRYLMSELGAEPQLAAVPAMPVSVAPVGAKNLAEVKPAPKRRTTRKKTTTTKATPAVGF